MMKRISDYRARLSFASALALLLLLTLAPNSEALVPKSGATCPKLGQIADYQGKRFTCVKSGNKKVWNKGVALKASPTPTSKQSSSSSPTASISPTTSTTSSSPSSSASASPTPSRSSSPSPVSTVREFTLAEVRTHNSSSSCWSIINGDVYDLTKWISSHPGGAAAIQGLCGVDGTRSFNSQHEGEGKVMRQLTLFYLGRYRA